MSRSTDGLDRHRRAVAQQIAELDRAPVAPPEDPPVRSVKGVGFLCPLGTLGCRLRAGSRDNRRA